MKKTVRVPWYLAGLILLALGSAVSIRSALGVTATASIGYVISGITGFSMGLVTVFNFILFIVAQLFLVSGRERLRVLLQLPFSLFFSGVLDLFLALLPERELQIGGRWVLLALGVILTAAGVFLTVSPGIVPTAPDGFVRAASARFGWDFGAVKNVLDLVTVALASALGILCLGSLEGIGAGTLVSALLVGPLTGLLMKRFGPRFQAAGAEEGKPPPRPTGRGGDMRLRRGPRGRFHLKWRRL